MNFIRNNVIEYIVDLNYSVNLFDFYTSFKLWEGISTNIYVGYIANIAETEKC